MVDYTHFVPGRPDRSLFDTPDPCKSVEPQAPPGGRRTARQTRLLSLVPAVQYRGMHAEVRGGACMGTAACLPTSALHAPACPPPCSASCGGKSWSKQASLPPSAPQYDAFLASAHGAGRSHASLAEYRRRAALFSDNLHMIREHNAANRSFTMAMNRWVVWIGRAAACLGPG